MPVEALFVGVDGRGSPSATGRCAIKYDTARGTHTMKCRFKGMAPGKYTLAAGIAYQCSPTNSPLTNFTARSSSRAYFSLQTNGIALLVAAGFTPTALRVYPIDAPCYSQLVSIAFGYQNLTGAVSTLLEPAGRPSGHCTPQVCDAVPLDCGGLPDGCGGVLYCGACDAPPPTVAACAGASSSEGTSMAAAGPIIPRPLAVNKIYVVQPFDTLMSISSKFYGDPSQWRVIAAQNKITNPLTGLTVGMTLVIPPLI